MPTYVLEDVRSGTAAERYMSFDDFDRTRVNGGHHLLGCRLFRVLVVEQARSVHDTPGNWPMESWALGVGEHEVKAAEARLRKAGVPTHFNPNTGDAILTSRAHRNQVLRALGFVDRSGGYGDYTGR